MTLEENIESSTVPGCKHVYFGILTWQSMTFEPLEAAV